VWHGRNWLALVANRRIDVDQPSARAVAAVRWPPPRAAQISSRLCENAIAACRCGTLIRHVDRTGKEHSRRHRMRQLKCLLPLQHVVFTRLQEFRSKIRALKKLGFFAAQLRCIMAV
jgi:hypothetical protein